MGWIERSKYSKVYSLFVTYFFLGLITGSPRSSQSTCPLFPLNSIYLPSSNSSHHHHHLDIDHQALLRRGITCTGRYCGHPFLPTYILVLVRICRGTPCTDNGCVRKSRLFQHDSTYQIFFFPLLFRF